MITIEEMRAYKSNEEQKEIDKRNAFERRISELERKIVDEMLDDIVSLVRYGEIAAECGCVPSWSWHSANELYITDEKHIYTDGGSHWVGFYTCNDTNFKGVGIKNGGANGEYDLLVNENGISWIPNSKVCRDFPHAYYKRDEYKYCLEKFVRDYPAFKERVYALVEQAINKE